MKLYPFLFLISFTCLGQNSISVNQKKDSLTYYVEKAKDSLRIPYLKKAIQLAEEIENDSLIQKLTISYANASYFRGNSLETIQGVKLLENRYAKKKDSFALAKLYHIKAMLFKRKNKLDSSFFYYQQSGKISHLINDSLQTGRRLLSMGLMQKNENDLVGAESSLVEALKFLEPQDESRFTANTYNNLGLVLIEFQRFGEARESFNKAYETHKKNEDVKSKEEGFLDYFNNTGYSYLREEKYNEAIPFLKEGLRFNEVKKNYEYRYQGLLGNLSECLYAEGSKEEAWLKLFELLKSREETGASYGLSLSHNGLSYYYIQEGKKTKALFHAKKGYELAKKVNNNATKLSALLKLGELTSGNTSKQYYQEYAQLSDSLNNRERYLKNQFAKVRYETDKKDKLNADLKRENELKAQEARSERLQKIVFGLLGVLGVVFIFVYSFNRRKKMMYEAQLQKASAREEERQQIAKSLHDEVAGDLRMIHQKLVQNNVEEAKNIENIKENVRNLSHQLSSVSFEEVSFKDQMINLISDAFSPSFRITTEGIDTVIWKEINSTIKRTLYLCIRESLQNTMKYAEANTFIISFSQEKKEIKVLLKDNGKGFDEGRSSKGIGLKNLKERVEEIRGSFVVESSNEGTKTSISIPIHG